MRRLGEWWEPTMFALAIILAVLVFTYWALVR